MTYVMSDIHGCYNQYLQLLEEIEFSGGDVLYVLGDIIDRGDKPVELLRDMSIRANVIPIMGNHEYMAVDILRKLMVVITENNHLRHIDERLMLDVMEWQELNGGGSTMRGFGRLSQDERAYILEYIEEFSLYEIVTVNGQKYLLTHAGVPESATLRNIARIDAFDFATAETDYSKVYFNDAVLVTGHLPTLTDHQGKVWRGNNHIRIDTGCVFGGKMCCVCLDTGEEFYV